MVSRGILERLWLKQYQVQTNQVLVFLEMQLRMQCIRFVKTLEPK